MNIEAVIFDFDGTLVNSTEFVISHITDTCKIMGVKIPQRSEIFKILKLNLAFEEIFERLFGKPLDEQILTKYRETAYERGFQPINGAILFVQKLAEQKIPLIIATNRIKMLEFRLTQAGFKREWFYALSELEFKKPDPKAFYPLIKVIENLGVERNGIYFFGDHIDDFVSCPPYLKDNFLALTTGITSREEFLSVGVDKKNIFSDYTQIKI